ncbi:hypothetical protein VF14_13715 [Nostoc linckia z18]|uniref:Uncharacterized protein n=2 Tax=Nostoc linckia TaxID=92942 RepID=A0A9Q5ZCC6_NOSLI|nr:hypothetical protein [Nostoc linckia]PHK42233.1 hypothetical protein VF12_03445 [Nostoc linckia z15]PHK45440.1 hypothetical protein VF13_15900 [Nostoc linckia z16]PHJ59017.1 hypothetical protein VF02_25880 [Nostoc linckia z1]PHJ61870.1 hypothetical protein VF05_27580 [Nostoc linckia z3]PHJ67787.1 hypothetical protein VF03_25330 [Nostoc linckia z2]
MKKFVTVLVSLIAFEIFFFSSEQAASAQDCGSKDGYNLPCWREYLDSGEGNETLPSYPYAKRPNGCSIPGGRPGEYDNFGSLGYDFSFTEVCNNHDRCYYTIGTTEAQCNTAFTEGLFRVCHDKAFQPLKPQDILSGGISRATAIENCLRRAEWMSQVVVTGGLPFPGNYHQKAQDNQADYLRRVNDYIASFKSCLTADLTKALVPCNQNPLPIYSATYNPLPYRPGSSGWTGRIGKVAFNNGTQNPVKVTLYHPDAPREPFKSWTVLPGQNLFLGDNNYGMDWGIQVNNSPVYILGRVSAWNNFNDQQIFQSGYPFWLHN